MRRRLSYTKRAQADLRAIAVFIFRQSADREIAIAFTASLRQRCERLAALPGTLGTARPDLAPEVRSTPHRGYILYFRYLGDLLEIVAILDARRDALGYFEPDEDL